MSADELLVSRIGRVGAIRLNRPRALNSLTLPMVRRFAEALADFEADDGICAVLVTGSGARGLCAGGDIREVYFSRGSTPNPAKAFWREEYRLNARIASFPKRYVAIMDGIVMGGGVGISAHGNRRIVTERTRLAMPETGIGFVPDVGSSWLLTRRGGGAGIYMALSGASVGAADALHLGLADFFIESEDISRLESRLGAVQNGEELDATIASVARKLKGGVLEANKSTLDAAMRRERVEDILAALRAESGAAFAREAAMQIGSGSPTSLKLTHALLKLASRAESLQNCLTNEFRAACALLGTHDLYEGIRAAIIDKDRSPRWAPASLAEVEDAAIAALLRGTGDPEPFGVTGRGA